MDFKISIARSIWTLPSHFTPARSLRGCQGACNNVEDNLHSLFRIQPVDHHEAHLRQWQHSLIIAEVFRQLGQDRECAREYLKLPLGDSYNGAEAGTYR